MDRLGRVFATLPVLPALGAEGRCHLLGGLAELDHRVRAESGQHAEDLLVAPRRDDPAGAEVPRGLHREQIDGATGE